MVTKPTTGQSNWDAPLNAALDDLQGQINSGPGPDPYTLAAWTYDPIVISTGSLATNGTLYLSRVNVRAAFSATRLIWGNNTAGVSPTSSQNFVGVYNSSGSRVASVNVDARVTTTGLFVETISLSLTAGFYWVGLLFNAGTAPQPYRAQTTSASLMNAGVSTAAASARFATNGTGLTSLPSSITPASNTNSSLTYWAALG